MELAKIAFEALLSEVQRDSPSPKRSEYDLNTSLVLRRSTAMARPGKQGEILRKGIWTSRLLDPLCASFSTSAVTLSGQYLAKFRAMRDFRLTIAPEID